MAAPQQNYDWLVRFSFDALLIFIFLFIFLHPLGKLSKTRPAMIIVFSRAIGSFLRLLTELPSFLIEYVFYVPPIIDNLLNANSTIYDTVLATHILALAVNRAHAMLFPFHYNCFSANKRNFYLICAFLWLFSLIVGSLDQTMFVLGRWEPITLYFIILKICLSIGALCYAAITFKMIWQKYIKKETLSSGGASSEKDLSRILIVCFSCLFMASLRYFLIAQNSPKDWPEIAQIIYIWLSFFTLLLSICAEEICLFILVVDFRKGVQQQFRRIFCCFTKKSSSATNNINNNINIVTSFSSTNPRIQINNWTQNN